MAGKPGTYPFGVEDVGSYITLFNFDYRWMGSFKILTVSVDGSYITIECPSGTHLPLAPATYSISWAITRPRQPPPRQLRGESTPRRSHRPGRLFSQGTLFGSTSRCLVTWRSVP